MIKNINIANFRSFQGAHTFDLDDKSIGLHNVRGTNGAGKSSIFEAMYWTLFGKTTRNLKAGNVQNWRIKDTVDCSVTLDINGGSYDIRRTWGPNGLTINGDAVDQQQIDELLKLSADAFQHAILIGQFATTFFDLAPTPKLAVFSKILDLDVWLNRSIKAAEDQKKAERSITKIENELSGLDGQVEQLANQIEEYERQQKEFDDLRQQQLDDYRDQVSSKKTEVAGLKKKLARTEKQEAAAVDAVNQLQASHDQTVEFVREKQRELVDADYRIKAVKKDNATITSHMSKFEKLGVDCPECFQKIDEKHQEKVIRSYKQQLKTIKKQYDQAATLWDEINDEIKQAEALVSVTKDELLDGQAAYKEVHREYDTLQARIRDLDGDIRRFEEYIKREEKKDNPYTALLDKAAGDVSKLEEQYLICHDRKTALELELESVAYWVRGFKEIRLFVLEQALVTLEVEVNNYLAELGLLGWEISFDVERETKSGSVSKGFLVNIQAPHTNAPVPWEAWSGGELQRLRIAGALGIANIIRRHTNCTTAPLILDEPTRHLNQEGIGSLVTTLDRLAATENMQIWLIDHHTLDVGEFTTVTSVVNGATGSRILNQ